MYDLAIQTDRTCPCALIKAAMLFMPLALGLAEPARADTIEHLVFTGKATCETGFKYQECSSGGPLPNTIIWT